MDLLVKERWGLGAGVPVGFQTEAEFQDLVQQTFERTLTSQGDRPAVIAREVSTPEGGRIDVVAVDQDGVITLCECKLDRNAGSRREVLGQILEYGGSLHGMKFGDFRRLVSDRIDADLVDAMRERAGDDFDPVAWEDTVARSLMAGSFRRHRRRPVDGRAEADCSLPERAGELFRSRCRVAPSCACWDRCARTEPLW